MARQLRIQYAGAIYHVTIRSNGKEELYGDDCDQRYFLSHLAEAAENHTPSGTVLSNSAENTPTCTSS